MNLRSSRWAVVAVAAMTSTVFATTSSHTPQQPPAQAPVIFTSEANVARIDVRITDKSGKPITDLRQDEVQVLEGGVGRPVLMVQRIAEAGRTYAESAQRTVAAEISTNQGAPRGQLYVLLFDQEHITAGAEQKVRLAAERFLKDTVHAEDRVAIYGVPAPGPALTFTNNRATAVEQLQHIRGGLERLTTGAVGEMSTMEAYEVLRGNESVMTRFLITSDDTSTSRASAIADMAKRQGLSLDEQRRLIRDNAQSIVTKFDGNARRFLQIAAEVLHTLRNVDGRKTILLFSEGFYGDNVTSETRSLAAAAAEVYGVIYAMDLNSRFDSLGAESSGTDIASEITSRTATVGSLAAETSGALIPDAISHLDSALGQLGTPNNDYYVVGFEPSHDALDDRNGYRKVEIRVTRPNAVVQTRTGYAAGLDRRADNALPSLRRLAIDSALAAPFGHQGLKVEYTTYQSHEASGSERVVLSLEAELPVLATGNPNSSSADVVFVVRDARTGRVAASGSDQIALPSAPMRGRSIGVAPWRVQFTLAPGDYLMRCIVREPGGLMGSADRQFIVRALGGPSVAPSDLVLGRPSPELPVRATAYTAEPLPGAVRVYGRTSSQLDAVTARLELLPVGGASAVIGVSGVATDIRESEGQALKDFVFDVPLSNVPAGEYVARVELRTGTEPLAELRRQVTVILGAAPAPAKAAPVEASAAADGSIAITLVTNADQPTASAAVRQAASGVSLLKAGKYAEAVAALRAAFDQDQTNAPISFVLGWSLRGTGANVDAVSAFRNAATIAPAMIPAHLALADTYLLLQQPALAIQALETGLTAVPNSIELKRMLETIKK